MDHIVYLDAAAKEFEQLLSGTKTMIIRGAAGRKIPYGRVDPGDCLYFILNNSEGVIRARAWVQKVIHSEKLSEDGSIKLISENREKLQLTEKQLARWSGKRYLVLIEVEKVEEIIPFGIDKSSYGNMDDWLPVGEIGKVKLK